VATLEELDNWGTMDAIDSFGNLEQLDGLTLQQPTAAVSLSASASGAVRRILAFAAAVTGAASVAAYASFIARFTAAVSVAATSAAAVLRVRPFDASAAVSGAASGVALSIRGMLSSVSASVTAASGNAVTFVNSGAVALAVTTSTLAHRLGDRWSVAPSENETWLDIPAFPETLEWTEVSTGTERWAVK